jgi:hypothetical protein
MLRLYNDPQDMVCVAYGERGVFLDAPAVRLYEHDC